jgi:hypothetical protein
MHTHHVEIIPGPLRFDGKVIGIHEFSKRKVSGMTRLLLNELLDADRFLKPQEFIRIGHHDPIIRVARYFIEARRFVFQLIAWRLPVDLVQSIGIQFGSAEQVWDSSHKRELYETGPTRYSGNVRNVPNEDTIKTEIVIVRGPVDDTLHVDIAVQ